MNVFCQCSCEYNDHSNDYDYFQWYFLSVRKGHRVALAKHIWRVQGDFDENEKCKSKKTLIGNHDDHQETYCSPLAHDCEVHDSQFHQVSTS